MHVVPRDAIIDRASKTETVKPISNLSMTQNGVATSGDSISGLPKPLGAPSTNQPQRQRSHCTTPLIRNWRFIIKHTGRSNGNYCWWLYVWATNAPQLPKNVHPHRVCKFLSVRR